MSASDYPEHLNPFNEDEKKKSGLSFSHSFKDFKKTIRQSFRIKKKDRNNDVQIRRRTDLYYPRQTQTWAPPRTNHDVLASPALPRSRFKERLAKSYNHNNVNGEAPNPFEDDDAGQKEVVKRPARRKKKAPAPPKSSSSQDVNEEYSIRERNDSKWSLTSLETEASTENPSEISFSNDLNISSELQTFTREMQKLNDDTNNNAIDENPEETKACSSNINIPDLVISCAEDDQKSLDGKEEITESNLQKIGEKNESCSDIQTSDEVPNITQENEKIYNERDGTDQSEENKQNDASFEDDKNSTELEKNEKCLSIDRQGGHADKSDDISGSSTESLTVLDITSNLKTIREVENIHIENKTDIYEGNSENTADKNDIEEVENKKNINGDGVSQNGQREDEDTQLNFNERKSIYINGSRDELNSTGEVFSEKISLYVKGSREELDNINNNDSIDDNNGTITVTPKKQENIDNSTPKQRKNKLTKHDLLLGQEN